MLGLHWMTNWPCWDSMLLYAIARQGRQGSTLLGRARSARPTRSDIMACWKTKMEITHKWVIIDAASQPASQPACLPASQPARLPASCASWQQPGRSANPRGSNLLASGVPSTNADDVHGTRETRMYQTCCHLAIRHEHAPPCTSNTVPSNQHVQLLLLLLLCWQ